MRKTTGRSTASVAVVLGLLWSALIGGPSRAATTDPFEAMGVDRLVEPLPAPDVPFRSLDGRDVRLRDLRGHVVLLGFFTTW